MGLSCPLLITSSTFSDSDSYSQLLPIITQGIALREEVLALLAKGAIKPNPPSPGFCSRLFVVWKTSGSWKSVIDLSRLNGFVHQAQFKMETSQSILQSVRRGDWIVSIDLKNAYLQVPVHPDSRRFLHFVVDGQVYQFRALCFGLSTAPQVFTRVMAPVLLIFHRIRIRLLRYLDDWLLLASPHQETLQARDTVLSLCRRLGIVINPQKSVLNPCQMVTYLGMVIASPSLRAFPSPEWIVTLLAQIAEFLSSRGQSVVARQSLLRCLSSLCRLVPSGRLCMRSLHLLLRQQ